MDNEALFVENGVPVKFFFHSSITQGRKIITRDIKRHGGEVVASERDANVLLIDEEQDLVNFRRRYYHARERYRLALYVENRGFVHRCIRGGAYTHERPVARRMPGVARRQHAPARVRVPFTEEDKDNLAYYIATTLPTQDGRMGNKAYKDLEILGQGDDPQWAWVKRHTWHSWREHYKMNPALMDDRIEAHLRRLKGVGHRMGQDPRRHQPEEEEEETESEEEERERMARQRREKARPPETTGKGKERHEPDLASLDEEEEESQRVERPRVHHDVHRRSDYPDVQRKRARVSEAPSDGDRASGDEAGSVKSTPLPEENNSREGSPEIEDDDLFGSQQLGREEQYEEYDDSEFPQAEPFPPNATPEPGQDAPPPSTQATLVAQSPVVEKERPHPSSPTRVVETTASRVVALEQTPSSSQQMVVVVKEREVRQSRVGGAPAQQGPSMRQEATTQGGTAMMDAPFRNTRARSRSVEPESLLQPRRESRKGRGKGKAKEVLAPIEDVVHEEDGMEEVAESEIGPTSLRDEASVEGMLEQSDDEDDLVLNIDRHQEVDMDEVGESQEDDNSEIAPQVQDVDMDQPLDSDDAETHAELIQGQDMNPVAAPEPRRTRSMAKSRAH